MTYQLILIQTVLHLTRKIKNSIDNVAIGFEVSGNMVVSGDIYNKQDISLDVKNQSHSKSAREMIQLRLIQRGAFR